MAQNRFPFVIAAPTMRIPGEAGHTLNAYLAMRAALVAIHRNNRENGRVIRTAVVPGLCTGGGQMPCSMAAHQMRAAYEMIVGGRWRAVLHPAMAPFAVSRRAADPQEPP